MQPEEANDGTTDAGVIDEVETAPEPPPVVDLDGGGDPACWMGLIDDQRDHQ